MFSCSFFCSKLHSLSGQKHDNTFGSSELAPVYTSALVDPFPFALQLKERFIKNIGIEIRQN